MIKTLLIKHQDYRSEFCNNNEKDNQSYCRFYTFIANISYKMQNVHESQIPKGELVGKQRLCRVKHKGSLRI